jgi:hypothetical protein
MRIVMTIRKRKAINANLSAQIKVRNQDEFRFMEKAKISVELTTAIDMARTFAINNDAESSTAHIHHVSGWNPDVVE